MTAFKVCCIKSADEADMAIRAGADALGLVAQMVSGPGIISDADIKEIAAYVHSKYGRRIWTVLLTSRVDAASVVDHIAVTGANAVQLVDYPDADVHQAVRRVFPDTPIIQVVHVEDESAVETASRQAETADYILLDSGKPSAEEKTFGGTGETHDWSVSAQIVKVVKKPVFLAGGLNPANVCEALKTVRPYGVDLCSGLRDKAQNYKLVQTKLDAFAANLRRDF